MDLKLAGSVALITGASKGIGRETARLLASEGCKVVITARDAARLDTAGDELRQQTGVRSLPSPAT